MTQRDSLAGAIFWTLVSLDPYMNRYADDVRDRVVAALAEEAFDWADTMLSGWLAGAV